MIDFDSSSPDWVVPPVNLALTQDAVDIWLISLTQPAPSYESLADLLSSSEHERAERFKFDVHRRRFVVAHVALRSILTRYFRTSAANLQFATNVNGKPSLAGEFAESGLQFNLSHSDDAALLALVSRREIGVDIELVREDYSFEDVAARFFTSLELAAFRALPVHLQRQGFFKCWTSKEAFLKAKGTGLSGKLDEVEISLAGEQRVVINASVPGWTLSELSPGNGYEAALVVEGGPLPVNCYRWKPVS